MLSLNSSAYKKAPIWGQELVLSGRGFFRELLRGGPLLHLSYEDLAISQWLNPRYWQKLQLEKLTSVLGQASKTIPFYKTRFASCGYDANSPFTWENFEKIPILSKREVIAAGDSISAPLANWRGVKGKTSGTTGTSLEGYRTHRSILREAAFITRQLQWAGYKTGEPRVWLRGDEIVPLANVQPPYWRFNRAENMLMMSSFHLSEQSAAHYFEALEKFDPVLIQAYPTSIAYLAKWLENNDRLYKGKRLRGIVTSSEAMPDDSKKIIERTMGCKVFDWYGSFERVAAIGTCEFGNHHIQEDYGYTELIPLDDGSHEIIGTGFDNSLMPLIRYRSVDSVILGDSNYVCPCGRTFRVVDKVLGRLDDTIITQDGKTHIMPDFIFGGVAHLVEAQIIQDRLDAIRLRVVPAPKFGKAQIDQLTQNAQERFGSSVNISVELVDNIPRTANGKFRCSISNL
jgi:phenylacetate-CoA ligase